MRPRGALVPSFTLVGLAVMLAAGGHAATHPTLHLEPGPYAVGYRVEHATDPSRSLGPRTDLAGKRVPLPLSRPVPIHVWYPAADAKSPPMKYRDYIVAAASDSASPEGILAEYSASPRRRGADASRLDSILAREMRARRDAPPAAGAFPLILYAPSINSDPYENAVLFEQLASRGYVVASAPSVGLQEPEVSRDRAGAVAQVGDLGFVLGRLWNEPWVDRAHVGVLGYSWGGMTGLLFAIPHRGIDAVACLDGAHTMVEYGPVAESFDTWVPRDLRAAQLEIVLAGEPRGLGFALEAKYADTHTWRVPGLLHRDFAADQVAKYRVAAGDTGAARVEAAWGAVAARVTLFFDAYLKRDAASLRTLRQAWTPIAGIERTYHDALPAPPTPAQFDEIIETRGADAAAALFHSLRKVDPGVVVFTERQLTRYATLWGPERSKDLLILLPLCLEVYPRSVVAHVWLAQVHLELGDEAAAKRDLRHALEIEPANAKARALLERLGGRVGETRTGGGRHEMPRQAERTAELATIEQVIKNSIRWVLTKDKELLYGSFAMDSSLFWFSPDSAGTISGADAFRKLTEELFMNPDFKGVRSEFKDLRITMSRSGECAWWSCYLDDFNEWKGRPSNWVNVRWTGVLEKMDGAWKIRQMHFSHAEEDFR